MGVTFVDFGSSERYQSSSDAYEGLMHYEHLSLDRLKEMLDYDGASGIFRWKKRPSFNNRKRPGDLAGNRKPNGFVYIGIDGRSYLAHQVAFFYANGRWADGQVSFKNGNRSDLRSENLVEMRTTRARHDLATREGRAKYRRDYYDTNREALRGLAYKRYYGLSFEQYKELHTFQNGCCAICLKPEASARNSKTKWLAVDHCHDTGAVRGLLCYSCNTAIGRMGDDPKLLERAAAYLRSSKAKEAA